MLIIHPVKPPLLPKFRKYSFLTRFKVSIFHIWQNILKLFILYNENFKHWTIELRIYSCVIKKHIFSSPLFAFFPTEFIQVFVTYTVYSYSTTYIKKLETSDMLNPTIFVSIARRCTTIPLKSRFIKLSLTMHCHSILLFII